MSHDRISEKFPRTFDEAGYEIPRKYQMMSPRKYNIAVGTALALIIIAVILAWIGLSSGKPQTALPQTPVSSSI